jgi:sortase A
VRTAGIILLLAAWFLFYALALSGLQATRSQELAYQQLREHLALATVPIGGVIESGTPVALLEAPRVGMRYVVVEGTTAADLRAGPGHRGDTPLPGQAGVSVIYGRGVTFGGPFRHLTDLRPGDVITATTGQGTFDYRVDGVRHAGDALPDPVRSNAGRLTLVTAEGSNWRAGWAPDAVVYVDASLQGRAQPAPAGRPTAVAGSEKAMRSDSGALVALVLWLQLLVVAVGMGTWAQVRWGGAQAWLAFVPIIMAALWGASESALQLLPNLL